MTGHVAAAGAQGSLKGYVTGFVLSVVLTAPAGDTGRLEVRHGGTVLTGFDLAVLRGGVRHTFDAPPLAGPGDRITLAVYCGNADHACTPDGTFTAALVR